MDFWSLICGAVITCGCLGLFYVGRFIKSKWRRRATSTIFDDMPGDPFAIQAQHMNQRSFLRSNPPRDRSGVLIYNQYHYDVYETPPAHLRQKPAALQKKKSKVMLEYSDDDEVDVMPGPSFPSCSLSTIHVETPKTSPPPPGLPFKKTKGRKLNF